MQLDELRNTAEPRLARITTLSRRLRWALLLAIALLLLISIGSTAMLALGLDLGRANVEIAGNKVPVQELGTRDVVLLSLFLVPGLVVTGAILYQYERLLALYERGVILMAENALRIRRAGHLMVVLGVLGPVFGLPTGIAATQLGWGVAIWEVRFDASLVLAGVANIVIGHVMSIACDITEDAELTI